MLTCLPETHKAAPLAAEVKSCYWRIGRNVLEVSSRLGSAGLLRRRSVTTAALSLFPRLPTERYASGDWVKWASGRPSIRRQAQPAKVCDVHRRLG